MADFEDEEIIEDETEEIDYNYGGRETIIQRIHYQASTGFSTNTRAYTEVSSGTIKMGYTNGNNRISRYTFTQASSGNYLGLAINANRIKIMSQSGDASNYRTLLNGNVLYSGYMQAITKVTISSSNGAVWEIEKIPFIQGLCVVDR